MVVTVVGLGFVGLTAALGFCEVGHTVYAVEADDDRRNQIRRGELPFYEPGMQELLDAHLGNRLVVLPRQDRKSTEANAVFYCVGTPCGENGAADLGSLLTAIRETLGYQDESHEPVLVVKSTVPPRTMHDVVEPFVRKYAGKEVLLANNPEFLREGKSIEDFMEADRVVIGATSDKAFEVLRSVYEPFNAPVHRVSPTTAEFIKYLSNTLLATMISYANEMARVGNSLGDIDVAEAFSILQEDRRWNSGQMKTYVYPGCGYGGYCLPKDTAAMQYCAHTAGVSTPILDAVIHTNETVASDACDRILMHDSVHSVGILGLSFKPETDDVRDSPAARIINQLFARGVKTIVAYDPMANSVFQAAYPELQVRFADDAASVIEQTERQAIVTAWDEFAELVTVKTVVDCRYMH